MAEAGLRALQDSALRLTEDARLLFRGERYASAAQLAAMALDEYARIFVLLEIYAQDRKPAAGWKIFRRTPLDFPWGQLERATAPAEADTISRVLAYLRGVGNIVDCVEPGRWVDPAPSIDPRLVETLIGLCETVCRERNDEAIKILLETIRAAPKRTDMNGMLDRFQAALDVAGLSEAGDTVRALGGPPPAHP